jgi:hypothetical protein
VAREKPQHQPSAEDKAEATTPTQADVYEANAAGANPAKAAERRGGSAAKKRASKASEQGPDDGALEDEEPAPRIPDVKDPDLASGDDEPLGADSGRDDLADHLARLTKRVDKLEKRLKKAKKK